MFAEVLILLLEYPPNKCMGQFCYLCVTLHQTHNGCKGIIGYFFA